MILQEKELCQMRIGLHYLPHLCFPEFFQGSSNQKGVHSFADELDHRMTFWIMAFHEWPPKYSRKHVSADEASLQYCFTNQDKSMVITTMKISDSYFNVNYSLVY